MKQSEFGFESMMRSPEHQSISVNGKENSFGPSDKSIFHNNNTNMLQPIQETNNSVFGANYNPSSIDDLSWTGLSDACISKLADRVMELYNKGGNGELSDLEIANFMGDSNSTPNKTAKKVNLSDIKSFREFNDTNKDGRYIPTPPSLIF